MNFWDALDPKYRLILCDVWGVVHDGVSLYPGAAERLTQWRREHRCVVLVTNAPRTAEAVEQQLVRIGLPRPAYDAVATSGEAGIEGQRLRTGFLHADDWDQDCRQPDRNSENQIRRHPRQKGRRLFRAPIARRNDQCRCGNFWTYRRGYRGC